MPSKDPIRFLMPLLKTPGLIPNIARATYIKRIAAPRQWSRSDHISEAPIGEVRIKITDACNLRCKMCPQWGPNGYNFTRPKDELKKIVPVERYLELADSVKKDKPLYAICGGEPFLYPGLFELTARIKQNKSLLSVVTNGTTLEDHAEEIVAQGWDCLLCSIDGTEEIHDQIRGRKGTFEKVARGIAALKQQRSGRQKKLPWIAALVTIHKLNAARLPEILDAARSLGVDAVVTDHLWWTDERTGQAHAAVMEKRLGVTPFAWKGFVLEHDVDVSQLIASFEKIRKSSYPLPLVVQPDLKYADLASYYKDPSDFLGYGPCLVPWMAVHIMPNGDVSPCMDFPDYIVGNIMQESLHDIWNGERYRAFRKALKENGGTFPICSRCCGLMTW